jgi:hypothetical protein
VGTVRDVIWREGVNSTPNQPCGIMFEFDGYIGPAW